MTNHKEKKTEYVKPSAIRISSSRQAFYAACAPSGSGANGSCATGTSPTAAGCTTGYGAKQGCLTGYTATRGCTTGYTATA